MGRLKILVVLAVIAAGASVSAPAFAVSYTIATTADVYADDGQCTLREAIFAAGFDAQAFTSAGECPAGSSALDQITLPAGTYTIAIPGVDNVAQVGDLDIRAFGGPVTITGADPATTIIDGGDVDRVFQHAGGNEAVTIENVTIRNGTSATDNCEGGGIKTGGDLTLNNVVLTGNHARDGGGIFNSSPSAVLRINDSSITSNTATFRAGGLMSSNVATTNITRSEVTDNSQVAGASPCAGLPQGFGGIVNDGVMTIVDSTIDGNSAVTNGGGGGIYNSQATGDLTVTSSTISRNNAVAGPGGGIKNEFDGSVTIENSTVSGNNAGTDGGAIYAAQGEVHLESATVANNLGASGTDGIHVSDSTGTYTAQNTIVTGGCGGLGTIDSLGHNIDTGGTCGFNEITDQPSTDPMLETLLDNGGPTETHKLEGGSPAIDTGQCPGLNADQRGIPRPQGTACDVGAFETTPPSVAITFPQVLPYRSAAYAAGCADNFQDVCGTAAPNDDGDDVFLVEVQIQRASDNGFWDGDSFETTAPADWLDASGTTSWAYQFVPPDDDEYLLSVRATDEDGYVGDVATVMFAIDNLGPTVTIDPPTVNKRRNRATFTFSSSEPGSTFECRRDAKPFAACTSPTTLKKLRDGKHTFEVRATDAAGNVGPPSSIEFKV